MSQRHRLMGTGMVLNTAPIYTSWCWMQPTRLSINRVPVSPLGKAFSGST